MSLVAPRSAARDAIAAAFCRKFLAGGTTRYVLGTTTHAASIAGQIDIDGFIDDFRGEREFLGKPVLRMAECHKDALVVSTVLGKAWTAKRRLDEQGLENLDYYAFHRHSGMPLARPFFWDDFSVVFAGNRAAFEALHETLADEISRRTLRDIVNFRLGSDIYWMQDYTDRQDQQYFEPFLQLLPQGESFVDVGGFDGFTSEEFIRRCPDYAQVHIFEPEPHNMTLTRQRLHGVPRIAFHPVGVSDHAGTLRLSRDGSTSRISADGEVEITLDTLDALVDGPVTLLKMDIEGAERPALDGARELIRRWRPRIAVAAYHRADDFVALPAQVLPWIGDCDIYLRHYTECRDESVLFFLPRNPQA